MLTLQMHAADACCSVSMCSVSMRSVSMRSVSMCSAPALVPPQHQRSKASTDAENRDAELCFVDLTENQRNKNKMSADNWDLEL